MGRFCAELGLSNLVQAETLRILREWDRMGVTSSSSPVGNAAAAIYLAADTCREPRYQTAVAKVTGVTEVTLRSRLAAMQHLAARLAGPGTDAPKRTMRVPFPL